MQQEDFFFFLKSHPPQRGSYTVAPPNKHFAHSTQMAHQNALIHTPVLSHTTCITSKQNLLSSCPYRRFHFGQFPVVLLLLLFFWGGVHALSSPAPSLVVVVPHLASSLLQPLPHPLSTFPQIILSQQGNKFHRQAGREGCISASCRHFISFVSSFSAGRQQQQQQPLRSKPCFSSTQVCVPTASPRRG